MNAEKKMRRGMKNLALALFEEEILQKTKEFFQEEWTRPDLQNAEFSLLAEMVNEKKLAVSVYLIENRKLKKTKFFCQKPNGIDKKDINTKFGIGDFVAIKEERLSRIQKKLYKSSLKNADERALRITKISLAQKNLPEEETQHFNRYQVEEFPRLWIKEPDLLAATSMAIKQRKIKKLFKN